MVNPKYKGKYSIAISQNGTVYGLEIGLTPERLNVSLERAKLLLGDSFNVLIRRDGVDLSIKEPIIDDAIERLKSGEKVDLIRINLEKLLE